MNKFYCFLIFSFIFKFSSGKELEIKLEKVEDDFIVLNIVPTKSFSSRRPIDNQETYPYHLVKQGEYLKKIANYYDKKIKTLVEINEIENPNLIYPKQKIYLEKKEPLDLGKIPEFYTVKPGDNLISIAYTYNLKWQELKKLNNLKKITEIHSGQIIRLKVEE